LFFLTKPAHDYEVEALKALDQSLEALDRRGDGAVVPVSLVEVPLGAASAYTTAWGVGAETPADGAEAVIIADAAR
jgi:hypothetical protein